MQLLRQGWSREKATNHRAAASHSLLGDGFAFGVIAAGRQPDAAALLNRTVPPSEAGLTLNGIGIGAFASNGSLAGALEASAFAIDSTSLMVLHRIGVAEEVRGRGIGTVLVGLVDQLLPKPVDWIFGSCGPSAARFYQRCGYSVLRAGERLSLPGLPAFEVSNSNYPCAFVRDF